VTAGNKMGGSGLGAGTVLPVHDDFESGKRVRGGLGALHSAARPITHAFDGKLDKTCSMYMQ